VLHTTVTIGYDVPWRTVHTLLVRAAGRVGGILEKPEPFVLQTGLGDFSVSYELNAFTADPHGMTVIYSRLHEEIQNAFNEAGVEIMSPHFTAVRDGNRTAIPDTYLPKNYRAPAFSIGLNRPAGRQPQGTPGAELPPRPA
jgi:small-conductance mechanosensitive channel